MATDKDKNTEANTQAKPIDFTPARAVVQDGGVITPQSLPDDLTDRQARVMSVLPDAAAATGVAPELLVGMWGRESEFSTHDTMTSPTGVKGDFQVSRVAVVETLAKNGGEIAERLDAQGLKKQADKIEKIHEKAKDMDGDEIRSFVKKNGNLIDSLREAPEATTYTAAFYSKDIAQKLDVDPAEPDSFPIVYAGYNIGPGNAQKLQDGKAASGWEVDANKGLAGKASADKQISSYEKAIEKKLEDPTGQKMLSIVEDVQEQACRPGKSAAATYAPEGELQASMPALRTAFSIAALGDYQRAGTTVDATMEQQFRQAPIAPPMPGA
ncbi:hypothetical protein [Micavibrio aeruginosavorus]|uniref:Transglycosylase SLT domain-containing protein n=1 Tax=Micavibrio aeruginosavorus (strain ARL-13) TaxID=856793 RepID=G2KP78_MICAA|nr:hypothetical protein [Micavibrio aeruginosavorus]AEP08979.1 hypothetical protein MICA_645 [Micavibrio aeruginosavorus ARL-13]